MVKAKSLVTGILTLLLCLVVGWSFYRFGGTQLWTRYLLFLGLAPLVLLACWALPAQPLLRLRARALLLLGIFILAQYWRQPSFPGRGWLHLALGWCVLFLSVWLSAHLRGSIRWIYLFVILLGFAESVYGLMEVSGRVEALARNPDIQGRLTTGTLINPNHYAGLLNMSLLAMIGALAGVLKSSSVRWRSTSVLVRVALAAPLAGMIPITLFALLRAESRGALLALASAGSLMIFLLAARGSKRRSRWIRGARGAVAVVAVTVLMAAALGVAISATGILSLKNRGDVYRDTIGLIADNPWLGVGPGMWQWRFRAHQTANLASLYHHTHNDYLETASDWGLPAALAFWLFVAWITWRSARVVLRQRPSIHWGMALGCTGALTAILVHSLVDFNLQIPGNWMVFSLLLGLAWVLGFEGEDEPERRSKPVRIAFQFALRIVLPFLLLVGGARAIRQAEALEIVRLNPNLQGMTVAVASDPDNPELRLEMGLAYRDRVESMDLEKARQHLEASALGNPYRATTWIEIARLEGMTGNHHAATVAYQTALVHDPWSDTAVWGLANSLLRLGDLEAALEPFARVVQLGGPRVPLALNLLLSAGAGFEELDRVWSREAPARLQLLNSLCSRALQDQRTVSPGGIRRLWEALLSGAEPPGVTDAKQYLDYLLQTDRAWEARAAWENLAAAHGLVDPPFSAERNFLWNGEFTQPLTAGLLDWSCSGPCSLTGSPAISGAANAGVRSGSGLHIDFAEGAKLNSRIEAKQTAILHAGRTYQLSFHAEPSSTWSRSTQTTLEVRARGQAKPIFFRELDFQGALERTVTVDLTVPQATETVEVRILTLLKADLTAGEMPSLRIYSVVLKP